MTMKEIVMVRQVKLGWACRMKGIYSTKRMAR
jgi:hypothetical protein